MRAKRPIQPQPCQLSGWERPCHAATSNTNTPAGINRTVATNIGVVSGNTPFIATIAVPQRKKGAIRNSQALGVGVEGEDEVI